MKIARSIVLTLLCLSFLFLPVSAMAEPKVTTSHGYSLVGPLKYGPDFKHFDYANPDAPKGGTVVEAGSSAFDTFNVFALGGTSHFSFLDDYIMMTALDEYNSLYGHVAESVTWPDDYSWVEFKIRDEARFYDGKPITADDLIYTVMLLKTKASPRWRGIYRDIDHVEKIGPKTARVVYQRANDASLPWRFQLYTPILPKHYWEKPEHPFDKPSLDVPPYSSAYMITDYKTGEWIIRTRVKDYWGENLPCRKGYDNFDVIRTDIYRDQVIGFQAFLAGEYDYHWEQSPGNWTTGYDVAAVKEGKIIKEVFERNRFSWPYELCFNNRLDKFKDPKIREAIAYAFDWDWINKNLFHGLYARQRSYWELSPLAHTGAPKGYELELLQPYKDKLDPRIFKSEFNNPKTDATEEGLRKNLRYAAGLLKDAGYTVKGAKLVDPKGQPYPEIEIIFYNPMEARMYGSFIENLKFLGITASMRQIDMAEWNKRQRERDFDLIPVRGYPNDQSPGTGMKRWAHSATIMEKGGFNRAGVGSPIIDALLDKLVANARDREKQVATVHALDRIIMWSYYTLPLYYDPTVKIAYSNKLKHPDKMPDIMPSRAFGVWWIDPSMQ